MRKSKKLKALEASAAVNRKSYRRTKIDSSVLEAFDSPVSPTCEHESLDVIIRCPEFTSLCPITGQPDFATIIVTYRPNRKCVESKSLKLYLGSFRNVGMFHEACVTRIGRDLVTLLNPDWMTVKGEFAARGGIPFWPTFSYHSG